MSRRFRRVAGLVFAAFATARWVNPRASSLARYTQVAAKPSVTRLQFDEMRDLVVKPSLRDVQWEIRKGYSYLSDRLYIGKVNDMDATWLNENYEYFAATNDEEVETGWYQAYQRFNGFGTFDNKFTDQLGLIDGGRLSQTLMGSVDFDDEDDTTTTDDPVGTHTEDDDQISVDMPGLGFLAGLAGVGTGAWLAKQQADATEEATGKTVETDTTAESEGDTREGASGEQTDTPRTDTDTETT